MVSVSAGNDVRTDSGEETQRDDVYQYSKKSGLMGGRYRLYSLVVKSD